MVEMKQCLDLLQGSGLRPGHGPFAVGRRAVGGVVGRGFLKPVLRFWWPWGGKPSGGLKFFVVVMLKRKIRRWLSR